MKTASEYRLGSLDGGTPPARHSLRARTVFLGLAVSVSLALAAPSFRIVHAGADDRSSAGTETVAAVEHENSTPLKPSREIPKVASRATSIKPPGTAASPPAAPSLADSVALAKQAIAECQKKFAHVRDYTCTFHKRERIEGALTGQHVMWMKARTTPASVYFKFQKPNKGREAIYVTGRNKGKVVAHDVGLGKFLAGTMHLDPRGTMAMEECRHPVTEAGIGSLIEQVAKHWAAELTPEESVLTFQPNMQIGTHACTMIESVHPNRRPDFLFHKVRLYIDHEHGLPIRFEAYDWPKKAGTPAELVEEYTYLDLRVNVGLSDHDFDPGNKSYSYGRF